MRLIFGMQIDIDLVYAVIYTLVKIWKWSEILGLEYFSL